MKVSITGATGFLGSHIVDKCIQKGYDVTVLVRKTSDISYLKKYDSLKYITGSLDDTHSLAEFVKNSDIVIHSAGRASDYGTKKMFYDANYYGTRNIIDACKNSNIKRLVYVSSPSVVFDYNDEVNIDESYPYPKRFANLYSETKALAEQLVMNANGKDGLTTIALRPHAIWGPRDTIGFFPRILGKIKKGRLKKINTKNYTLTDISYVENVADACVLAGEKKEAAGKIYFISDENPVNVWEFSNEVCKLFGLSEITDSIPEIVAVGASKIFDIVWKIPYLAKNVEPPITRYGVGMITRSTTYNISAAKQDLGYSPLVDHKTGLITLKKWVDETGGIDQFLKHVL